MRGMLIVGVPAFLVSGILWSDSLRETGVAEPATPATTPSTITSPDSVEFNYDDCITSRTCRTFEPFVLRREQFTDTEQPAPLPDYVKREADEGEPQSANRYGLWLIKMDNPRAAEPYLLVAASAGFLDSHAALAQLKSDRGSRTDRIEAWAHLRTIERDDGPVDQTLFDRLDGLLSDEERTEAEDLAWQFRETMRRARNDIDRLKN